MSALIRFGNLYISAARKAALICILLVAVCVPLFISAQFLSPTSGVAFSGDDSREPIVWSAEVKMKSKTEGQIIFKATLSAGWHLYGTTMPETGPRPTHFLFPAVDGVEYTGELTPSVAPVSKKDTMFGGEIQQWEEDVTFTRPFLINNNAPATITIPVEIEFMGCNDKTCMPPSIRKFNLNLIR